MFKDRGLLKPIWNFGFKKRRYVRLILRYADTIKLFFVFVFPNSGFYIEQCNLSISSQNILSKVDQWGLTNAGKFLLNCIVLQLSSDTFFSFAYQLDIIKQDGYFAYLQKLFLCKVEGSVSASPFIKTEINFMVN